MRTVHKRRRDRQRACPAAECFLCGGELYRGEARRRLAGRTLCQDCIRGFCRRERKGARA